MSKSNHIIKAFSKGTHNVLDNEDIPSDAAQESFNWLTVDGVIELVRGREFVGDEGLVGQNDGIHFGFRNDGTAVLFQKVGSEIQWYNPATDAWVVVVSGLTVDAYYTFTNYTSLAGNFVIATGADGIWKIHTANPGSALAMYDEAKNFKGNSFIDRSRMILWGRKEDKTGLYGSWIDGQDSTVYTTVTNETAGTGDGTEDEFTHTLTFKSGTNGSQKNCFAVQVFIPTATTTNISNISQETQAVITVTSTTNFVAGEYIRVSGVVGMTEINGKIAKILNVIDGTNLRVAIDSSAFTGYSSGGAIREMGYLQDDYNGNLTGTGGSGTVNYITGAIAITTTNAVPTSETIKVDYQWENSNNKGITDFTYDQPRNAGEGFVVRQDEGGDAILKVEIGQDGAYYSMKSFSAYRLELDTADENPLNEVFRKDIGIPTERSSVSTGNGIVFINTANESDPKLTILQRNKLGDTIEPFEIAKHFQFSNYRYDDAALTTFGEWTVIACKRIGSIQNDSLLLVNVSEKKVGEVFGYQCRTFTKSRDGYLYAGSSFTKSSQKLFIGFDDDGEVIDNYWESKAETYNSENLKKFKKLVVQGKIDTMQVVEIYLSLDDGDPELIGTIRGDGDYVDADNPFPIGSSMLGVYQVGGSDTEQEYVAYRYFREIKIKMTKFRKRSIAFKAKGFGYVSINFMMDDNILVFEQRIPKRFRIKQNENLAGTESDLPKP